MSLLSSYSFHGLLRLSADMQWDTRFFAGASNSAGADATFFVTQRGTMVATNAQIRGSIQAGSSISGTSISTSTISGGAISGTTITGTTISGSTISGGTIKGVTISGSTIYGASISWSGGSLSDNPLGNEVFIKGYGGLSLISPVINLSTASLYWGNRQITRRLSDGALIAN